MKILIITNSNPINIIDIMNQAYCSLYSDSTTIISPQYIGILLEETKNINYGLSYYFCINSIHDYINNFTEDDGDLIVIGVIDKSDILKFDAVINIDDDSCADYNIEPNNEYNVNNIELCTVNDADCSFNNITDGLEFVIDILNFKKKGL